MTEYPPPPGPPPGYHQDQDSSNAHGHDAARVTFAPNSRSSTVQPNAPPSYHATPALDTYAPPQGPPPSRSRPDEQEPPPYEAWMTIPDTALLPPPPSVSYSESGANASADDADRAHAWTDANPLWPPRELTSSEQQALSIGFASVIKPRELTGTIEPQRQRAGVYHVRPHGAFRDACLLSSVPLYSPIYGPAITREAPRFAYFEVRVLELSGREAGVSLGFVAPPYPTWRFPGWERASLGVHGDDGRRYVNDTWGGQDFTQPFRQGDIVGIGMKFCNDGLPRGRGSKKAALGVEVFFTRNGRKEGSWNLHEEVDAARDQPGGVLGLEGEHDLYAAVGAFGRIEFEMVFGRHNWAFHPWNT